MNDPDKDQEQPGQVGDRWLTDGEKLYHCNDDNVIDMVLEVDDDE
jgi:hypothetical protein